MAGPAIAFRGVTYQAQRRLLLGTVDLEVQRCETLVLLGHRGSGKTTCAVVGENIEKLFFKKSAKITSRQDAL
jgi:ABC-type transporter Mla maintaining outer membrane lipid asymmetry ATPase subunit MlaF